MSAANDIKEGTEVKVRVGGRVDPCMPFRGSVMYVAERNADGSAKKYIVNMAVIKSLRRPQIVDAADIVL